MTTISKHRIESLDQLKGLVIVIMAIDHVRDYFQFSSYFFDPTDPALTTIPLFLSRFMTNFCAPAFSFLAGLSAFMVGQRKTPNELSAFLLVTLGGAFLFLANSEISTPERHSVALHKETQRRIENVKQNNLYDLCSFVVKKTER